MLDLTFLQPCSASALALAFSKIADGVLFPLDAQFRFDVRWTTGSQHCSSDRIVAERLHSLLILLPLWCWIVVQFLGWLR